jgi:hypothetical protein
MSSQLTFVRSASAALLFQGEVIRYYLLLGGSPFDSVEEMPLCAGERLLFDDL